MRHTLLRITLYLLIALALLTPSLASAQEPTPVIPDDAVNAIAKGLYCPVCENVPLDVCPTLACQQWRELIREQLAAGWTEEQVKAYFVEQYGERVLAEPPRRGLNWLVYVIPPVVIAGGGFLVYQVLRSWNAAPQPARAQSLPSPQEPEDEYIRRLEEELRRRD